MWLFRIKKFAHSRNNMSFLLKFHLIWWKKYTCELQIFDMKSMFKLNILCSFNFCFYFRHVMQELLETEKVYVDEMKIILQVSL